MTPPQNEPLEKFPYEKFRFGAEEPLSHKHVHFVHPTHTFLKGVSQRPSSCYRASSLKPFSSRQIHADAFLALGTC